MDAAEALKVRLEKARLELSDLLTAADRQRIKIEVIEETLAELGTTMADVSSNGDETPTDKLKIGPTAAIFRYLKHNPDSGMAAVIDALKDKIKSASENKAHIIRTSLSQLEKRGAIIRRDGLYSIAP